MLGLSETTIDQLLNMASSVRWCGHVLRRALDLEVKGGKGGQRGNGKAG